MSRLRRLKGFVKALEGIGFGFDVRKREHRFKLQKYVYIVQKFGVNLGYDVDLYLHGAYSLKLAADCFMLDKVEDYDRVELPTGFVKLVRGKSERYLEFVTNYFMLKEKYPEIEDEKIVKFVVSNKVSITEEEMWKIIREIRSVMGKV